MRNLTIDMGNTRMKAGLFSDYEMLEMFEDLRKTDLKQIAITHQVDQVIVLSVVSDLGMFEKETGLNSVLKLTPELEVPVKNEYRTPSTLGMDRLAGVVGASQLYPNTNCLVIDAGTTITYDFLHHTGEYRGGGIAPGIDMRFRSLSDYTKRLPLANRQTGLPPLVGDDTIGSIRSGVLNGVISEIEGIIRRYEHKFSTLKVVICGGDASYFESRLKASIFVVPQLVLIGLNSILLYHAQNK
jgi:type III pantothenate kinase